MIEIIKENWKSQNENNGPLDHLLCALALLFRGQSLLNFCLAVSSDPHFHASRQYACTAISWFDQF